MRRANLKAKGSMRARERREHVGIAQISGSKNRFLSCLLYCLEGPRKPLFRWARCLTTGSVYFIFHCNNHVTSFFTRHWELRFDVAPELGLLRGLSCGVRSFDEESGSLAMRSVQYRRVLPEKQSVIPGGYRQNIWRDQFLRLAQG